MAVVKSLAERVAQNAIAAPDAPAYLVGDDATALSWSGYLDRARRLAALIVSLGFASGDRIAVLLRDGPAVHIAFLAIEMAGGVVVGLGARAGPRELRHILTLTGARGIITGDVHQGGDARTLIGDLIDAGVAIERHLVVHREGLEAADFEAVGDAVTRMDESADADADTDAMAARLHERRTDPEALFLINSTSGTTGMPKCVRHDQLRWFAFHEFAVEAGRLDARDVFMSVVPAPFGFGLWTAHFTPTLLGVPTLLQASFDADEALRLIETHRVTVLAAVSTQFIMMLESPEMNRRDLSSLRVLFTGGEAVPRDRAEAFESSTGARVLQFYGSNEVGAVSRTCLDDPPERRFTTAGRAIPEMNVRLFDEAGNDVTASGRGQPACKGPTLSQGYYGDAAANAALLREDGWMLLGDIVTIDAEGYLSVVGRTDDFIIRGGKNISASAVEEAVGACASVALAAAVAMPDPVFGEKVCVYVEAAGHGEVALPQLLSELGERGVSKEIFPERLIVLDEIPRASGGKIAKGVLREDIRRRVAAESSTVDPAPGDD
jgi:acyl-CoA synthetase